MGVLTLKPRLTVVASPNVGAVNLDALSTGVVVLKDNLGVERSGFTTDLYLKTSTVPGMVAGIGTLYGTGSTYPVAYYKDSSGNAIPLTVGGARWEQSSQTNEYFAAGQGLTSYGTGLFVDPPAGQVVAYTIGASQVLVINTTPPIIPIATYGEQALVFLETPFTPDVRFEPSAQTPVSGTIFTVGFSISPTTYEILLDWDNTGSPNGTNIVSYLTLSAAFLLGTT